MAKTKPSRPAWSNSQQSQGSSSTSSGGASDEYDSTLVPAITGSSGEPLSRCPVCGEPHWDCGHRLDTPSQNRNGTDQQQDHNKQVQPLEQQENQTERPLQVGRHCDRCRNSSHWNDECPTLAGPGYRVFKVNATGFGTIRRYVDGQGDVTMQDSS